MSLSLLVLAALLTFGWLMREPVTTWWRRAKLRRQPFPEPWRAILRQRVPYFRTMPADLQLQLKRHIQVFLAEKAFIGCGGLEVTDEMRVTIAAQACLLILNRRVDYFANLREILLYPEAFLVDKTQADDAGVQHGRRAALSGESWSRGQVILSWDDAAAGARKSDDGHNVVIHEFAHQLDQANGPANGAPHLVGRARRARWAKVFAEEFAALQASVREHRHSLFDSYGASEPAEFFAVASEVFFEQPQRMAAQHAALYAELSAYYRVNPLSW